MRVEAAHMPLGKHGAKQSFRCGDLLFLGGFSSYWCATFLIKPQVDTASSGYALLQLGVQTAVAVLVLVLSLRSAWPLRQGALQVGAVAAVLVGGFLSLIVPYSGSSYSPLAVTTAFGVGFALLFIRWLAFAFRDDGGPVRVLLPLAFALGNGLILGTVSFVPSSWLYLCGLVLLGLSVVALLCASMLQESCDSVAVGLSSSAVETRPRRVVRSPFLGLALFSLVYGVLNELLVHLGNGAHVLGVGSLIVSAVVFVLLAVSARGPLARVRIGDAFFVLLLIVAAVMLLVPFAWDRASWLVDAVVKVCYLVYQCLFFVHLAESRAQAGSRTFAMLVGAALCLWACSLAGMGMGTLVLALGDGSVLLISGVSMAVVWLCLLAGMLFFRFEKTRDAVLQDGLSESEADRDADAVRVDRIEALAGEKGLSPRETEVLSQLVKGRSVPFVAQEFSLSEHTVKTHVKHIYEKIGVHTRQELLTLFEKSAG